MKRTRIKPRPGLLMTMAISPRDRLSYYGPPLLVSQEEVGHRLGISRTTVWRLVKSGELEPVRIGSRTLISNRSIDLYLSRQRPAGQSD